MGLVYIASVTASASATVEFTTGIDATYNEYQFHFVNIHPATDDVSFEFQVNAHDGSSQLTGFNEVMTTTMFTAYHNEADTATDLSYRTDTDVAASVTMDQAQGTAEQWLGSYRVGNDADQSVSGILKLYDPSSTTYVKHFVSEGNGSYQGDYTIAMYGAGYINTTNAITQIKFQFNSGNIDAGTIHMYGVG
jgi:hypothetical protein